MFKAKKDKKQTPRRAPLIEIDGETFDAAAFRRGTTLATFKTEDHQKSERQRLKQLRSLRRRVMALIGVAIGVVIFIIALLSQFTSQITGVTATGVQKMQAADQQKYEDIVSGYFRANGFERFSFARRSSVLLAYMREQAPEVESMKIVPSGIMRGRLVLSLRTPVAQWISAKKTSFVDEKGVVFERNYFAAPALSIEDNSGAQVVDGVAASTNFLSFIGKTAVEVNKNDGLKVQRVVIPKGSARYVEFYLEGRAYPFKAQISRDAAGQAADIAVMARYITSHGLNPSYVDCRVSGKAYWK